MQITLSVLTYNDRPVTKSLDRAFNTFPIVIGRSTSCDYYLEDPNQYVSSKHAVVLLKGDQFFIGDTSSNGVYINGVTEPIGRKRTSKLNDQDTLAIGAYKLRVTITQLPSNITDNVPSNQSEQNSPNLQQHDPLGSGRPVRVSETTEEKSAELDVLAAHNKASPNDAEPKIKSLPKNNRPKKPGLASAKTPRPVEQKSSDQQENANQKNEQQLNENGVISSNSMQGDKQPDVHLADTPLANNPQKVSASKRTSNLGDSHNHLKIILRAASLDESDFSHLENSAILEQTGRLLTQMVDAMMELLRSRAEMKKYIHSDNTTLSASDNNPLKFSANSADALSKLLSNDTQGYLKSNEAIQDTVDDLTLHQLAMLEGTKMAVKSLLMKFDPNELAKQLDKNHGLDTNTPISRKAKMWELFCEQYDEIREEATGDFETILGAEFRKVFNQQMKNKGRN